MNGIAVRGVILMENEGGSEVENDVLGQGAESIVVVSVGKIEAGIVEEVVDSVDGGAISSEVNDWVVQKKISEQTTATELELGVVHSVDAGPMYSEVDDWVRQNNWVGLNNWVVQNNWVVETRNNWMVQKKVSEYATALEHNL